MAELHLRIVTPDRTIVDRKVAGVRFQGVDGGYGILPNHAPLMTALRPGVLTIQSQGKAGEKFFVRGGFAEVTAKGLTILDEEAMALSELDRGALETRIRNAEEDVADAKEPAKRERAQETLDRLRELQAALH
jgi:F-type H+-transporting ATPase subunit epsilon